MSDTEVYNQLVSEQLKLSENIDTLINNRRVVRQSMAEHNCPFKVGDQIINNKMERAEVVGVKYTYGYGDNNYDVVISKIKKGGGLYTNSTRAYSWDKWELVK